MRGTNELNDQGATMIIDTKIDLLSSSKENLASTAFEKNFYM